MEIVTGDRFKQASSLENVDDIRVTAVGLCLWVGLELVNAADRREESRVFNAVKKWVGDF